MRNFILFCFCICFSIAAIGQEYNQLDADGKRHGKWKKRFENSNQIRYEGTFEHGKEIGEFKFYRPNSGKQPSAIKVFSKDHDTISITYYTKGGGIVSKGFLLGKTRVGTWTYYHQNSDKVMMVETYKEGKLNGEQLTYFDNGKLTEKTSFVDGKRTGKRFVYSEEGKVLKEFTYEDDKLHGWTKYYNTQGELIIEGNYKRDRKDGIWKYYKNGKLDEEKLFPVRSRG